MAHITCKHCGAEFEDQEFCPNCGQWVGPVPEGGYEEFSLSDTPDGEEQPELPEPPITAPQQMITCPSCGALNPATNRHCEQCGARLSQGPLPVAPQPMIRATAGARALAVIVGTVLVVALLAFAFNSLFGDKTPAAAPTSSTTSTTKAAAAEKIDPISWDCSSELNSKFGCANLFDGTTTKYWNDASLRGQGAVIVVTFGQPVALEQIVFKNVTNDVKFKMNYKIKGLEITLDDLPDAPVIDTLENDNRTQVVIAKSLRTRQVTIRVTSTYPSESVDNKTPFTELALAEIEFWGRPTG